MLLSMLLEQCCICCTLKTHNRTPLRSTLSLLPMTVTTMVQMMALKVVKVDNGVENAKALMDNYSNEIELLKSLQRNRFIINLENSEVIRYTVHTFLCVI